MVKDLEDKIKEELFNLKIKDSSGNITPYIHIEKVKKAIYEIENYYIKLFHDAITFGKK
jgi:hypothetical protein